MKYLVLMYGDEKIWDEGTPDEQQAWMAAHDRFDAAVRQRATMLGGEALAGSATSTMLAPQVGGGRREVTEGPFAETVEQLGGYYVVEAADLDLMIDLCHELPDYYRLEIRPVLEFESEGP